jgi:hypothetical protein
MPDIRRRLRSIDLPDRDDINGRTFFRWGSQALFALLFIVALSLSFGADVLAFALLGTILVGQMLYVVLPMERIRGRVRRLASGEAGEDVYEELEDRGGGLR